MHILILDDQPEFTKVLSISLRRAGHTTAPFSCPKKALEAIGVHDVLITDYHMPGMTGLEVARRAYAQGWRGSLLLMSGHPAAIGETIDHPLLCGVLHKPFSHQALLQALIGSVRRRK